MEITSWTHNAAIYCDDCKPDNGCSDDRCDGDSDCCPQPVFSTSDESDTPQHCAVCNVFLENALTSDGVERLRENLSSNGNVRFKGEMRSFYGLEDIREWPTLTSQASAECLQEAITQRMRGVYGLYAATDTYALHVGVQKSDLGSLFDAFVTAGNIGGIECNGETRLVTAEALAKFCAACLSGQIVADDDGCILDRPSSDGGSWSEVAADEARAILSDEFRIEVV